MFLLTEITESTTFINIFISFFTYILGVEFILKKLKLRKKPTLVNWFCFFAFVTLTLDYLTNAILYEKNHSSFLNDTVLVYSDSTTFALMIVLTGMVSMYLGELIVNSIKTSKRVGNKTKSLDLNFRWSLLVIFMIVSCLKFFLILRGIIGYGTFAEHTTSSYSIFIQLEDITYIFILSLTSTSLFFSTLEVSNLKKYIFWFLVFVQLFVGIISGMKEFLFVIMILVAFPYILSGRKTGAVFIIGLTFFLLMLYPLMNGYRDNLNSKRYQNKLVALKIAANDFIDGDIIKQFTQGSKDYTSRLSLFNWLIYSIENENDWSEYKYLNRYIYLPIYWFTPRFILPSKPQSNIGSKLYKMTNGFETNSVTPSTFGWSYFEGGAIFVVITFLILGFVCGIIELNFTHTDLFQIIFYPSILIIFFKVESDVFFILVRILQVYMIHKFYNTLLLKFLRRK